MIDFLMHFVSNWMTWLALGYAVVFYAGLRKSLLLITLVCLIIASSGFCDLACTYCIKPWVAELGPCALTKAIHFVMKSCGPEFGLPSTHAADAMAASTIFIWTTRGALRNLAILFAVLIGISRVYLGFHLVIDVLGAFLIGVIIGSLIYWLWRIATQYLILASWDDRIDPRI